MNLLALTFTVLTAVALIIGLLINCFSQVVPEIIARFFRYGRANTSNKSNFWQKIEVPKLWFWHFYAWAVALQVIVTSAVLSMYLSQRISPHWLSVVLSLLAGSNRDATVSATTTSIGVVLFLFHLTRRLYETLFVAIYSGTKMNITHYILGFTHYTLAIFTLISCSPGFISREQLEGFTVSFKHIGPQQVLGMYLIIYGNYQQYKAHKAFANLRKNNAQSAVTMEHKIPRGGLFELISCPNYWAEILIYVGFTFIFGLMNYNWNFCTVWVICNQIASGVMNHKWYLEKFKGKYPKSRKAIIPYIL